MRPSAAGSLAVVLLLACLAAVAGGQAAGERAGVVHVEPSRYAPVVVIEEFGERCIAFGSSASGSRQTCVDLDDPKALVFSYTRMMLGALYLQPQPARVLVIGLGGGTLPTVLAELLPQAQIIFVSAYLSLAIDIFDAAGRYGMFAVRTCNYRNNIFLSGLAIVDCYSIASRQDNVVCSNRPRMNINCRRCSHHGKSK